MKASSPVYGPMRFEALFDANAILLLPRLNDSFNQFPRNARINNHSFAHPFFWLFHRSLLSACWVQNTLKVTKSQVLCCIHFPMAQRAEAFSHHRN